MNMQDGLARPTYINAHFVDRKTILNWTSFRNGRFRFPFNIYPTRVKNTIYPTWCRSNKNQFAMFCVKCSNYKLIELWLVVILVVCFQACPEISFTLCLICSWRFSFHLFSVQLAWGALPVLLQVAVIEWLGHHYNTQFSLLVHTKHAINY